MKGALVFQKITDLKDCFIEEADLGLDDSAVGSSFKERLGGFLSSGLGVATICGILGLGIFGAILWRGQHEPVIPPPSVTIEVQCDTSADESTEKTTIADGELSDDGTTSDAEPGEETEETMAAETELSDDETTSDTEPDEETELSNHETISDTDEGEVTEEVTDRETESESEVATEPETEFELVTDEDGEAVFDPVGTVNMTMHSDLSHAIDCDGDLSEWRDFTYSKLTVSPNNAVSYAGEDFSSPMPMNFRMTVYAAADEKRMYLGFDVTDKNFIYAEHGAAFNGDAITLSLDFDRSALRIIEKDPDLFPENALTPVFYTFSCAEDGEDLLFRRGGIWETEDTISEANGDKIMGRARRTEKGFCAEIAISWERMREDNSNKLYADDDMIGISRYNPLEIACAIIYTSRDSTADRAITWQAATSRGGTTGTYYDCGINFCIPYEPKYNFEMGIYTIAEP